MFEQWPGDVPPTEEYWEALVEQGEVSSCRMLPTGTALTWRSMGFEDGQQAQPPPVESWVAARQIMEDGGWVQATVVACNRGGLVVNWQGLQGFVPASHLSDLQSIMSEGQRWRRLQTLMGQTMQFKIIEIDAARGRFVLSERASRSDEFQRRSMLDDLNVGDVCTGQVTCLYRFGAFVDLGGLEGLIHISELSWGRVDHPSDVVQPGQNVRVRVLAVDRTRGRVGLSLKQLCPDPWQTLEERYRVGQIVTGVVTNVVNFGAFVRVEEGLEGLIHVSELGEGEFLRPRSVLQEGQGVSARVIHIDGQNRRLGLALCGLIHDQADRSPWSRPTMGQTG